MLRLRSIQEIYLIVMSKQMNLAPIVLFVYNRPWHTQQTVGALQKNELASESELFIYSDEAKNENSRKSVDEVREYIDSIDGFLVKKFYE